MNQSKRTHTYLQQSSTGRYNQRNIRNCVWCREYEGYIVIFHPSITHDSHFIMTVIFRYPIEALLKSIFTHSNLKWDFSSCNNQGRLYNTLCIFLALFCMSSFLHKATIAVISLTIMTLSAQTLDTTIAEREILKYQSDIATHLEPLFAQINMMNKRVTMDIDAHVK